MLVNTLPLSNFSPPWRPRSQLRSGAGTSVLLFNALSVSFLRLIYWRFRLLDPRCRPPSTYSQRWTLAISPRACLLTAKTPTTLTTITMITISILFRPVSNKVSTIHNPGSNRITSLLLSNSQLHSVFQLALDYQDLSGKCKLGSPPPRACQTASRPVLVHTRLKMSSRPTTFLAFQTLSKSRTLLYISIMARLVRSRYGIPSRGKQRARTHGFKHLPAHIQLVKPTSTVQ